jgi:serine/threonine-protein kinase RsbT
LRENVAPEDVRIHLTQSSDSVRAVLEARRLAAELGFPEAEGALIATAVSELGTNIIRYAGEGWVALKVVFREQGSGIEVLAEDQGPGITDVDEALKDHVSTGKSLGLGLPSVRRLMDTFSIESRPGHGTRVRATKWR